MFVRTVLNRDAESRVQPNALTGDINRRRRTWTMHSRVARGAVFALATLMALPLGAAQAQPRGGPGFGGPGFGARGPGFGGPGFGGPGFGGGGWHGGWGGGWGWPFVGGALLGLGLGLLPYYAAPPPAYYPPAYYPPAYYPPPYYAPPGYYPYAYGYYPNAPGYYGYASPPAPYSAPQANVQQGYYAARDPNNCGTPDEPKRCIR
jgi:hypothetical protein